MRVDATIFFAIRYRPVSTFSLLTAFSTFSTFQPSTLVAYSSPSIHLILYRLLLIASYAPSDTPEPLLTSDLHGRCRKRRCRQILTFREGILASITAPAPVPPSATTDQRGL